MGQSWWTRVLNTAKLFTDLLTRCSVKMVPKNLRASLEINTTPVLIIIPFVFIITLCIFAISFTASGLYQLSSNWVLTVKLCKINFDTLSLKCLFCSSVSLEWNVLIPVIFFRENSSQSSCCYNSIRNSAECVISWLYLIIWLQLDKFIVFFEDLLLYFTIIKRSVFAHFKNLTNGNFMVFKPCSTH